MSSIIRLSKLDLKHVLFLATVSLLSGCGGGGSSEEITTPNTDIQTPDTPDSGEADGANDEEAAPQPEENEPEQAQIDIDLRARLSELEIAAIVPADLNLPNINDAIPQLGKQLFFAKNLGGEDSVACVSCHHPMLGGADNLSLPVGVNAIDSLGNAAHDLLGLGRISGVEDDARPPVPRNSPSVLNLGLQTSNMFWDGRIARTNNGSIITPDSPTGANGNRLPDPNLEEDTTLAAAQARFPVTSAEEMRGSFASQSDNQALRALLTAKFNNSEPDYQSTWPIAFANAFGDNQISFERIAHAIGEYQRSMVFVDSPWNRYLEGDDDALTNQEKEGAQLFFTARNQGGAGCMQCHNSNRLTDDRFHLTAFPQIGPGKGDDSGNGATHDFGREQVTGNPEDRFHFRTPSLLNVSVTAPYGHAGTYASLADVVAHYVNPENQMEDLFGLGQGNNNNAELCELPQFMRLIDSLSISCDTLYPDAIANSQDVIAQLDSANDGDIDVTSPLMPVGLNQNERAAIVAFLEALTDPCVESQTCMTPWLIDSADEASFPDANPLIPVDEDGQAL